MKEDENKDGASDEDEVGPVEDENTQPEEKTAVSNEGKDQSSEEDDIFDEDEKDLFKKLMKKLEDADELGKELDSDLGDFSERVENVMDSVDRIENLERSSLEGLIYKEPQEAENVKEVVPVEPDQPDINTVEDEVLDGPAVDQVPLDEAEGMGTDTSETVSPGEQEEVSSEIEEQMFIHTDSPYMDIKEGRLDPGSEKEKGSSKYGDDVEKVLQKLGRLIEIKIQNNEMEAGKMLFNMAVNIGANSPYFRENFVELSTSLGIERPKEEIIKEVEEAEKRELGIDVDEETTVLDPELADEITILQKKAANAIQHLDKLIESSDLSKEDFNSVKESYLKATEDYRNKMFHRSYKITLEALELIKNQVQDSIDERIQEVIYKAKEMLEEFSGNTEKNDRENIEELSTTMDRAMKSYLTNEYEKANLLAKKVMNTILDLTDSDSEPLKEIIEEHKKNIRKLDDLNIREEEIQALSQKLKKAEELMKRRENDNAKKLLDLIGQSIEETRKKGEIYANAKEMEIKLVNKVERLGDSGYDLEAIRKKTSYLKEYLKEERYEDVMKLGEQIDKDIGSLEGMKTKIESDTLMEELGTVITRVGELEDPAHFKNEYSKIKLAYSNNELDEVLQEGRTLLEEIRRKLKTSIIIRGRKIAKGVIEAKLLMMKLRTLNVDISKFQRDIRKAKNKMKEGKSADGVKDIDRINKNMKKLYTERQEFLKNYLNVYRDSLEVLMDRHREEPVMYYIKSKHVPLIRKMSDIGRYQKALETYKSLEKQFSELTLSEVKKESIENDLTEVKFEIYKRKEEGADISEPLSLYTLAQKRFSEGNPVPTEYLVEVSRRYCDTFIPL